MASDKKGETPSEKARRLGPPTADRLKKKQARTRRVHVPLDDELAEQVAQLASEVEADRIYLSKVRANKGSDPERQAALAEKQERLAELKAELREATVVMKLASLGRKRYERLIEEHPLPKKEKERLRAENPDAPLPDFNPETFPAALVGASCVEPDLSEGSYWDEKADPPRTRYPLAEDVWDEWNQGELTELFTAAFQVNTQRRVVDMGEG